MPNASPDCHLCSWHLAIRWSFLWLLFQVPAQGTEFQASGHLVLLATSPILSQCRGPVLSPFHIYSRGLKRIFLWMAIETHITPESPRVLRALYQEPGPKATFSIIKYNSDTESWMKQIYNSINIKSTHSLNHSLPWWGNRILPSTPPHPDLSLSSYGEKRENTRCFPCIYQF